jgi:hypothetical protein
MKRFAAMILALAALPLAGSVSYCQQFDPSHVTIQQRPSGVTQHYQTDLPDLPESTPTLELPVAVQLPPTMLGCFRGESVLENATLVYGDADPDLDTSTVTTLCYAHLSNGRNQLKLDTAIQDPGKTQGLTSFTGFLLKTHMLKVHTQLSDVQLVAVPQHQPDRFVIKEHAKSASVFSLLGLPVEFDLQVSSITRCQIQSHDRMHCQTEETDTKDDGTWEVLEHTHVDFYRIGTQTTREFAPDPRRHHAVKERAADL